MNKVSTVSLKTDRLGLKEPVNVKLNYRCQELASQMQVDLLELSLKDTNQKIQSNKNGKFNIADIVKETKETLSFNKKAMDFVKTICNFDNKTMELIKDNADIASIGDWVNYAIMRIQGYSEEEFEKSLASDGNPDDLSPKDELAS